MTSVGIPISGVVLNSEMDWSSNSKNKIGDQSQIAESVHKESQSGFGLSRSPWTEKKRKIGRYVDPASRIDITECHSRLRWLQNYDIPCSPLLWNYNWEVLHLFRCFTHTHTHAHTHTHRSTWQKHRSHLKKRHNKSIDILCASSSQSQVMSSLSRNLRHRFLETCSTVVTMILARVNLAYPSISAWANL